MNFLTKIIFVKLNNGEELITLAVIPDSQRSAATFSLGYDDFLYMSYPYELYRDKDIVNMRRWCPVSDATWYRIPATSCLTINNANDVYAEIYANELIVNTDYDKTIEKTIKEISGQLKIDLKDYITESTGFDTEINLKDSKEILH